MSYDFHIRSIPRPEAKAFAITTRRLVHGERAVIHIDALDFMIRRIIFAGDLSRFAVRSIVVDGVNPQMAGGPISAECFAEASHLTEVYFDRVQRCIDIEIEVPPPRGWWRIAIDRFRKRIRRPKRFSIYGTIVGFEVPKRGG